MNIHFRWSEVDFTENRPALHGPEGIKAQKLI